MRASDEHRRLSMEARYVREAEELGVQPGAWLRLAKVAIDDPLAAAVMHRLRSSPAAFPALPLEHVMTVLLADAIDEAARIRAEYMRLATAFPMAPVVITPGKDGAK